MFEYGLYEENFELEVKRIMENHGYRVLHYVYVGYKGIISQIDLLAFGFGNVICKEFFNSAFFNPPYPTVKDVVIVLREREYPEGVIMSAVYSCLRDQRYTPDSN